MIDVANYLSTSNRVLLVINAGKRSSLKTLGDTGHEIIINLPISLMPRLGALGDLLRPIAVDSDTRDRDFDTGGECAPFFELMTGFFKPRLGL